MILDEVKDDKYIVENVKQNSAFKNYADLKKNRTTDLENFIKEDVDFFKARVSDSEKHFSHNDMYHIPFNKRGKVATQRFSIPGLPCVYLGRSSYICWIELGKPADNIFNVSHIRLDDDIKIFNLATNIQRINQYFEGYKSGNIDGYDIDFERLIKSHTILWMLSIATSYNINEKDRAFRSEYIISQLIMFNLKSMNINGIAYYSKRISEYIKNELNINMVLFADYNPEYDKNNTTSEICDKIKITNPVNFGEFKQTNANGISFKISYYNSVELAGTFVDYRFTEFSRLESYIKTINGIEN